MVKPGVSGSLGGPQRGEAWSSLSLKEVKPRTLGVKVVKPAFSWSSSGAERR